MKDFINYLTTKAWWLLVILLPFGLIILGIKIYLDSKATDQTEDHINTVEADAALLVQQNTANNEANHLAQDANQPIDTNNVDENWHLKRK